MPRKRPIIIAACLHGHGNSRDAADKMLSRFKLKPPSINRFKTEHIAMTPSGREVEILIRGVNPEALRIDPIKGTKALKPHEIDAADIIFTDYHTPHLLDIYERPELSPAMERAKRGKRHYPMDLFFSGNPEEIEKMHARMEALLK
jgi:hypothetical protein